MSLNLLAPLAVAVVAVFGAVQRLHQAAVMLVSLVLAGALAAVLGGPVADLFGSTSGAEGTWSYVGEAFCFWAILCVAFLGLRAAGDRLLPNEPPLPAAARVLGGGALGALAGYLDAGLCLIIVQMLPVAPAILGYEPFRYDAGTGRDTPERVERGDRLWLAPDRAAVWVFDTASGGALLGRYGDAYPPERRRPEGDSRAADLPTRRATDAPRGASEETPRGNETAPDADDFLYYHWYRRWQAVRWRTGRALGPVAEVPPGAEGACGLLLRRGRETTLYGMKLKVFFAVQSEEVAGFPDIEAPAGEEFLKVRLRMEPADRLPRTIDSAQFRLVDASGQTVAGDPMVVGAAQKKAEDGGKPEALGSAESPPVVPRDLRFAFPGGGDQGAYACTGMRFRFRKGGQYAVRSLVFTVPASVTTDELRLFMDPCVPPP